MKLTKFLNSFSSSPWAWLSTTRMIFLAKLIVQADYNQQHAWSISNMHPMISEAATNSFRNANRRQNSQDLSPSLPRLIWWFVSLLVPLTSCLLWLLAFCRIFWLLCYMLCLFPPHQLADFLSLTFWIGRDYTIFSLQRSKFPPSHSPPKQGTQIRLLP